ncbi:MAG: alpha/beta fold hydrolase [Candidatus Omnitrophota bacterium]
MIQDKQTGLMYRLWDCPAAGAVMLLVHGLGAHSARWEAFSAYLLKNNIAAYAPELRGFGETPGLRGHIDSFERYYADIRALSALIRKDHPGKKVFLLGESLGGLITFLTAISAPELFAGLICIAPAFKSRLKFSPGEYIRIFVSLCYNPRRQFIIPSNVQMCTRDTSYQTEIERDTREHHLGTSRLLFNTLIAQIQAGYLKGRLRIPTLFLIAGQDLLVDSPTSLKFFQGLKVQDKTIIQYPDMYHALSIDLDKEKVFQDILAWVQAR